jgi:hypothetical protein
MRAAVLLLAALSAALVAWSAYGISTMRTDAAGMGMAWGFWVVGAGFTACCMIPAVILAACNKAPVFALVLALLPAGLLLLSLGAGIV